MGRKIAAVIIQKVKTDGADDELKLTNRKKKDR